MVTMEYISTNFETIPLKEGWSAFYFSMTLFCLAMCLSEYWKQKYLIEKELLEHKRIQLIKNEVLK